MVMTPVERSREWLEADGRGGFASGTADGIRTRRYHALLLTATAPPTGRVVLVNGFDAFVHSPTGRYAISSQRYRPGVLAPDGSTRIVSFTSDPWPQWEFALPDGVRITQEILVCPDGPVTVVRWRVVGNGSPIGLEVRPFFSGRDYHSMHHENPALGFTPQIDGPRLCWHLYDGVPDVHLLSNARYVHSPDWYRQFLYEIERERGLDDAEDLASPGTLHWTLDDSSAAVVMLTAGDGIATTVDPLTHAEQLVADERHRRAGSVLDRAAASYVVKRGNGRTLIAGYPWFTDWGRDTFIAIRGLCIATGQLATARDILCQWATAVSDGMLPNRFPDDGEAPEFNAVDASLWFVVAVHDLLEREDAADVVSASERETLLDAVREIVSGYASGTRYGIRCDADGLLAAGEVGQQLTWMDARVNGREITPRIGKPVEVQALWLNALWYAARVNPQWQSLFERGRHSFVERFWNESRSCLYDVIDVGHVPGTVDQALRPNQILAIGGLPLPLLDGRRAKAVVDVVERELLTPIGVRSLARAEPGYAARYVGGPSERDAVYHQGTVWPWLIGPFVEAWIRVHGDTDKTRREARSRFVAPLIDRAREASGHLAEIADAEPPFTERGCPFQAWSLGELLRLERRTATDRR